MATVNTLENEKKECVKSALAAIKGLYDTDIFNDTEKEILKETCSLLKGLFNNEISSRKAINLLWDKYDLFSYSLLQFENSGRRSVYNTKHNKRAISRFERFLATAQENLERFGSSVDKLSVLYRTSTR